MPSGWMFLLFSGVLTLVSERLFMDQQNFWSTFSLHFSIGLVCFLVSLCVMWANSLLISLSWNFFCLNSSNPLCKFDFCFVLNSYCRERSFINKIVRFRQHSDWQAFSWGAECCIKISVNIEAVFFCLLGYGNRKCFSTPPQDPFRFESVLKL